MASLFVPDADQSLVVALGSAGHRVDLWSISVHTYCTDASLFCRGTSRTGAFTGGRNRLARSIRWRKASVSDAANSVCDGTLV